MSEIEHYMRQVAELRDALEAAQDERDAWALKLLGAEAALAQAVELLRRVDDLAEYWDDPVFGEIRAFLAEHQETHGE